MRMVNYRRDYIFLADDLLYLLHGAIKRQIRHDTEQAKFWFAGRKNGMHGVSSKMCREFYNYYRGGALKMVKLLTDMDALFYGTKRNGRKGDLFYDYK